ncbi:MAG: DUF7059 domain-containing protein [Cellulomonadaceae bacterium]
MYPPPRTDAAQIDLLRHDLRAADFTVAGVREVLGGLAFDALHRDDPAPARRALEAALAAGDPRAVLVTALVLGDTVRADALAGALPSLGLCGAVRLGIVAVAGADDAQPAPDTVRPLIDLRPYAAQDALGGVDWWLASDLGELATGRALDGDHVLGAGGASLTLAQVTIPARTGRVLDLGTGCGVQALHAARHAREIVATDVSARALAFARFNAALCEVDIDLREGSLLDPVAGEQFDLVVSNPPFVITPRSGAGELPDYDYRDGGRSGDDLVRDLVIGLGTVLAPGGVAQLLGNWEHRSGTHWRERVGAWLDAAGLDGWVIQREVLDPAEYAETWIRDGGTTRERDPETWDTACRAWLDDFAARGVEAVGFGIITLRRPADGRVSLRRLEEHTGPVHQPLGAHIEAVLAAHDWLAARDDGALAAVRATVAPDVSEERFYTPGDGDPQVILLRQNTGLGRTVRASTGLAALVGACDGELTVGSVIGAIAALLEVPEADLAAELLPEVRGLLRDGFLLP